MLSCSQRTACACTIHLCLGTIQLKSGVKGYAHSICPAYMSLDNKGSCWILKDFYCSVTILTELGLRIGSNESAGDMHALMAVFCATDLILAVIGMHCVKQFPPWLNE